MTTHTTPGELRLRLHLPAGRIEVTTWDEPTTTVRVEPLDSDPEAAEFAAAVTQQLRVRPGGCELVVETPRRKGILGFRHEPQLVFTITAPHGALVDVSTASADLEAHGRLGALDVKTATGGVSGDEVSGTAAVKSASGDVRLARVDGAARITTVSGDIHVGSVAGEAIMNLVSGDAHLGEAGASVTIKSVSGDIDLGAVRRGEVRLQSVSGDLTIAVVRGARLWMDVSSLSGETSSELDLAEGSAREVELRVRANSTSGDIRLIRSQRTPA